MNLVDRLFLGHYRDVTSVGVYVIGGQLGNFVNVLTVSVNQAFVPWFFEKCELEEEGRRRVARIAGALVLGYALAAMALSLFAPEVLSVMVSKEFRSAWRMVPFLAFSFVFSGIYYMFVNPLFISRTGLVLSVRFTEVRFAWARMYAPEAKAVAGQVFRRLGRRG